MMKSTCTYANPKHFKWLKERDHNIGETTLEAKILNKEILIIELDHQILGWLRFGFFWEIIPIINMLFIEHDHRRIGLGKDLVGFWEEEMKKNKHRIVMTSSQSNEDGKHFFRRLGYIDFGSLVLPNEPLELFFAKEL